MRGDHRDRFTEIDHQVANGVLVFARRGRQPFLVDWLFLSVSVPRQYPPLSLSVTILRSVHGYRFAISAFMSRRTHAHRSPRGATPADSTLFRPSKVKNFLEHLSTLLVVIYVVPLLFKKVSSGRRIPQIHGHEMHPLLPDALECIRAGL